MDFLLHRMQKSFPKLNLKAHTFEDVEAAAKKEHINLTVCEYDPEILGYYCTRKTPQRTKKFIVINSLLGATDRTFVGLHELGHYFLHVPVAARDYFYCRRNARLTEAKHDAEANAFALIAMIPLWMLIDHEATEFADLNPGFVQLLIKRKRLFEQYEI